MATSYGTVSVTTAATQIVASNPLRKGLLMFNTDADTIYFGPDSSITTANAIPLLTNATLINSGFDDNWKGSVFAIVGAGTADVRYWEWD